MIKTLDELMAMYKEGEAVDLISKQQEEVKMLQRVIVAKRAAERPGK